jgi:Hemerythrin HHE cation binding domain
VTATMDTTQPETPFTTGIEPVVIDLYRDIHKGIRTELFAATTRAGQLDPSDRTSRAVLADHVREVVELLVTHAEHEDAAIQPALEVHLPDLAERIETDHASLDGRMTDLVGMANEAADAADGERFRSHRLYVELASFTSAYLEHQDVEERVVMPALERAVGVDAVGAIHGAIIGSIPPDQLATSLAVMLPAMNVDDRAEMLGGMSASAPPQVFEGVWALAGSVLAAPDHAALAARLGLD